MYMLSRIVCIVFVLAVGAFAQTVRPPRLALFFKEEWKHLPPGGGDPAHPLEHPVTVGVNANPDLDLRLYGPSSKDIQLTGTGEENDPMHLWTGLCTTNCGAALRDKNNYVDLTGLARIRWVTKVSGFHKVRPIVKLADGTLLVGDHTDGSSTDWNETEFSVADVRWLRINPEKLLPEGNFVEKPDLSKVDEVGFADLMPASGHGPGGWSDLARIEVYGKPVKRAGAEKTQ
jgi:hypothetical protein